MRYYSIKFIYYLTLICCLLISCNSSALAQNKVHFRNKQITKNIAKLFENYPDVNGLQINFRNDTAESIYILGKNEDNILKGSKYETYYSLKYSGDLFFLKRKFPMIDEFVRSNRLADNIKVHERERNFVLVVEPSSTSIKPLSDTGPVFCGFRHSSLLRFVKRLNANYKETIVPAGDSILILQAIVNRDGSLGKKMLLHGNEDDKLYRYICANYQDYNQENKANLNTKGLFLPYLSGGTPLTSIIEIFVRLNPDRTFSVSGSGRERKLRMKDYKEDPNAPLQIY
ncbi:hypothetical protein [Sphingobacterium thalpophilum]|uniref:hypothetical protein n=1 Tax=Sphingobacterium thalpophilum TaxID=259 RepID=UPI002D76877F|nr:hypothetical protein [Sphingobacterium thalpophilum]